MNEVLPLPPVPKDCDLTGFPFMPLEVQRLTRSDMARQETPECCWAGVLLWCESWHQSPAASLPNNEATLASLAGYGRDLKKWAKVRRGALRGWLLCSDDRFYHPVVAEKALEAWLERLAQRLSSGEGNAKRWGVPFDRVDLDRAVAEARAALVALSPDSRTLSKRRPTAPPDDIPTGSRRDRKGQGQGQGQGQGSPSSPTAPAPDPTAASGGATIVWSADPEAVRLAIDTGNLHDLLVAMGVEPPRNYLATWKREADGMTLLRIGALLYWRISQQSAVRFPSGFRSARAEWKELGATKQAKLTTIFTNDMGLPPPEEHLP